MTNVIVSEYLSLDGIMEMKTPEEWHFPYLSDDMQENINKRILASEALLLGRVTYEIFAAYWPFQTNNEIADKLNSLPKYVVSTTLDKVEWNNSHLIKANVSEAISKLKQQPGGYIDVIGSAALVQSLMQADLIDEYWHMVHPVVVGKGKRLFQDGMDTAALKLADSKTFSSGVALLRYQPDRKA